MKLKDIKNKSLIELKTLSKDLKKELAKLKLDMISKKIKNVHTLSLKRKEIARVLTLVHEKELAEDLK